MIWMSVGEPDMATALINYDAREKLYKEFSPYNHVDKNDPPLLMTYPLDTTLPSRDSGHGIHHPVYGLKLKQKSDEVGHECHLILSKFTSASQEFLLAKLLAP
jgi:arylformamidase